MKLCGVQGQGLGEKGEKEKSPQKLQKFRMF